MSTATKRLFLALTAVFIVFLSAQPVAAYTSSVKLGNSGTWSFLDLPGLHNGFVADFSDVNTLRPTTYSNGASLTTVYDAAGSGQTLLGGVLAGTTDPVMDTTATLNGFPSINFNPGPGSEPTLYNFAPPAIAGNPHSLVILATIDATPTSYNALISFGTPIQVSAGPGDTSDLGGAPLVPAEFWFGKVQGGAGTLNAIGALDNAVHVLLKTYNGSSAVTPQATLYVDFVITHADPAGAGFSNPYNDATYNIASSGLGLQPHATFTDTAFGKYHVWWAAWLTAVPSSSDLTNLAAWFLARYGVS